MLTIWCKCTERFKSANFGLLKIIIYVKKYQFFVCLYNDKKKLSKIILLAPTCR